MTGLTYFQEMKSAVKKGVDKTKYLAMAATAGFMSLPGVAAASSGLPEMEEPSQSGDGGFRGTLMGWLYDGAIIAGLVIAVVAIYVVAGQTIKAFQTATDGRGWGPFVACLVVGISVILAIIWLMTEAAPILLPT